jgi:hypothetical protein
VLFSLLVVCSTALWSAGPLPQSQAYHDFADVRLCCCVPNFANVASNFGFLVVGALGLDSLNRGKASLMGAGIVAAPGMQRTAWGLLFGATFCIGLGSSYYHWRPTSKTLVWDRLPMSVAFAAIFALLIDEHLGHGVVLWCVHICVYICAVFFLACVSVG